MLVLIMAAGMGQRFGGLKQLAPVGPHGETIMDYTAQEAVDAGFSGFVVVVRSEIERAVSAHLRTSWPADIPVEVVCQDLEPAAAALARRQPGRRPPGTAHALWAARAHLTDSFGVVNADDLYGPGALAALGDFLRRPGEEHALVGYRLDRSFLGDGPVTRAVCRVRSSGLIAAMTESRVTRDGRGRLWARPLAAPAGSEPDGEVAAETPVSMNCWGLRPSILAHIGTALDLFTGSAGPEDELLLPDVVATMLGGGAAVRLLPTGDRCLGMTHPGDLEPLRAEMAGLVAAGTYPERLWVHAG